MGQVFTPHYIVSEMLDKIGFYNDNVLKKNILEPSFGDGQFLVEIVKRIIQEGNKNNLTDSEITDIIVNNVFGFEFDKDLYEIGIKRIKELLSNNKIKYNGDFPNLHNGDTIKLYSLYENKLDFVIGNPPLSIKQELCKYYNINELIIDNHPYIFYTRRLATNE
jgi:adenine-specific DNA-methyltransferase